MLEFKDLKCDSFTKQSLSMQLLYMFQDSLSMINKQYCSKKRIVLDTCEISSVSFTIRIRIYDIQDITFPIYWFSAQSASYRSVRSDSRSRISVEFKKCAPSFVEVVYSVWIDSPIS